jgi:heat shock protein HslJ
MVSPEPEFGRGRQAADMRAALLAVLLFASLVAGCDAAMAPGSPGPAPGAFVGPSWSAISVAGHAPVPGREPSVQFAGGQFRGSGGCNQLFGNYRYDQATGAIEFRNIGMTAIGCLDGQVSTIEATFTQALGQANRLDLDADGRLHLSGAAGEIVLAKAIEG